MMFQRSIRHLHLWKLPRYHRFSSSQSSISPSKKIGFVGLGNMGLPMCLNLVRSEGAQVVAFDINATALQKAESGGAVPATGLEDVAECELVFIMLPGCESVDSVMPSILDALKSPSAVIVDCSTVAPMTSRRWHTEAHKRGHSFIDAPVSGGVKGAWEATLTFMAGSKDDSVALGKACQYLRHMGKRTIPCGGPGNGVATKLCNNLALATQMIGICEAMNLGESLGVEPRVLSDVLNTSTAKCWSSEVNNPHPDVGDRTPASNDYNGGFGSQLMLKDLGLAVAAGDEKDVSLPLGNAAKDLYRMVIDHGYGNKDFGVILRFLQQQQRQPQSQPHPTC